MPATRQIVSYDLADGSVIWQYAGLTTNVIPCPVVFGDHVICMSGHRGSKARAIRLDSRGDVTDQPQQLVWQLDRDTPYMPSPLLYDKLLYFTKSNSALLTCVDAASSTTLLDSTRLPGLKDVYASPVGAAGRAYFTSREGTTLVIKNQPKLEILATNSLPEGIDASPAIVGRQLFLRGHQHLYCLADE